MPSSCTPAASAVEMNQLVLPTHTNALGTVFGGTIMSYCHTCSGGMTNIVLNFHPRVQTVIENYLAGVPCDISGAGVTAEDDSASTFQDGAIVLDAPWMDAAAADDPEIADFVRRASDFWTTWREAYDEAGEDVYAIGCGWDMPHGEAEQPPSP